MNNGLPKCPRCDGRGKYYHSTYDEYIPCEKCKNEREKIMRNKEIEKFLDPLIDKESKAAQIVFGLKAVLLKCDAITPKNVKDLDNFLSGFFLTNLENILREKDDEIARLELDIKTLRTV